MSIKARDQFVSCFIKHDSNEEEVCKELNITRAYFYRLKKHFNLKRIYKTRTDYIVKKCDKLSVKKKPKTPDIVNIDDKPEEEYFNEERINKLYIILEEFANNIDDKRLALMAIKQIFDIIHNKQIANNENSNNNKKEVIVIDTQGKS